VAEGEVVFAGKPYAEKHDSRGGNGRLLNGAGGGWLNYVRRSVADRAVGVCQSIRMKVCLLNAGADEKKDGARDGKQKAPAHIGRTMLCHLSHLHRRLYAVFVVTLRQRRSWDARDICPISSTVAGLAHLDSVDGWG
jgi:hypothetical protein